MVVGGGPAGSTCAGVLHRAGWKVAVLDRARFPRDKVCAGWVTPDVFRLLELEPREYAARGLTIQDIRGFRTGVLGAGTVATRYDGVVSYAIRRCEFDDFLLRRSGAEIRDGAPLVALRREGTHWIVNDTLSAPVVVGAGGHFCPVARQLRAGDGGSPPIVAKEAEFLCPAPGAGIDGEMPELFFCHDLEGYGWCVRKGDYLNVGLGRRTPEGFGAHVRGFVAFLQRRYGVDAAAARWRGHAYLAGGSGSRPLVDRGIVLIGDAAGLAYPESGEGIRPAVASGRLAAEMLLAEAGRRGAPVLAGYAEAIGRLHPPAPRLPPPLRTVSAALGRQLLRSRRFTRRVLLDRWFLRRGTVGYFEPRLRR